MKRTTYLIGIFTLLIGFCALTSSVTATLPTQPNVAAVPIVLKTGTQCEERNIVYAGRTMKAQFKGDWADYINKATIDGVGVTAKVNSHNADWSNSTSDVTFTADPNASSGERTVTTSFNWNLAGITSRSFKVTVIPKPSLTAATISSMYPHDCFQQVVVTLTGSNLLSTLGDGPHGPTIASAKIRADIANPLEACPGQSLRITNGSPIKIFHWEISNTSASVRLDFPQYLKKATVEITLTSDGENPCSTFGSGSGTEAPPKLTRLVALSAR